MNDINETLESRKKTHGNYLVNASITWAVMDSLSGGAHWGELHPAMKESLHMIAHKMHRIVNGDPFFHDHWHDLEGYAALVPRNWDGILRWRTQQMLPHESPPATAEHMLSELVGALKTQGFECVFEGDTVRLHRSQTPDHAAIAAARPLASPVEASQPSPPRVAPAPADEPLELRPSLTRREPISATHKEYELLGGDRIKQGSLKGQTWRSLYHSVPNDEGRFDMRREEQEEYGL